MLGKPFCDGIPPSYENLCMGIKIAPEGAPRLLSQMQPNVPGACDHLCWASKSADEFPEQPCLDCAGILLYEAPSLYPLRGRVTGNNQVLKSSRRRVQCCDEIYTPAMHSYVCRRAQR